MRRILLMVIRNILFVPVYWYKLCYHARHVEKYTEEEHYELLRYIDHRANTSGNINIKVYGQENIPDDNGFMFYQIIRDFMMYLRLWKRVQDHFR